MFIIQVAAMDKPHGQMRLAHFGPFEANFTTGELRKQGMRLKLQEQPFQVLKMLLARPGELVTREEIRQNLWPSGTFVDFDNGLNAAVNRLREALSDSAENPKFIETLPRRGYRFIGVLGGSVASVGQSLSPAPPLLETEQTPVAARPWWRSRTAVGIAATIFLLALAGAGIAYRFAGGGGETIDSVAVLPFVDASGDPNSEYLSDGITESLINSLSQLPHLKVMSRDSAFMYKGKEADARTVGQALGVRAVFKGRVRQRGQNLDISAELVNARDNSHIWGQQYTRDRADLFTLQNDLTREITAALRMRLSGEDEERMAKSYTANLEAYEDYLKGRYESYKLTKEGLSNSKEYFNRAIALDPNYARAYEGLAWYYWGVTDWLLPPREAVPRGMEAARKAVQIDDALAEGHTALGVGYCWGEFDWPAAEREYKRAIELNPNYATAHYFYGWYLVSVGRVNEAILEGRRAAELDPLSSEANQVFGQILLLARRYDEAIDQLRKTLDIDATYWQGHIILGRSYAAKGLLSEALAEFQKARSLQDTIAEPLAEVGRTYALQGRKAEAHRVLEELQERAKRGVVSRFLIATIYASLEDKDQAFAFLDKAYADHSWYLAMLNVWPGLDSLRSDPRFQDLLRRVGLLVHHNLAGKGADAAQEFLTARDARKYWADWLPLPVARPLSQLGLARAYALQGDKEKARTAYQDFFALWKDADPDIPVLKQARAEYAKLQ